MPVDVEWDGVSLANGAVAREQDGGWFVELEQPMPVGTSVALSGDVTATVTVARVHEGVGAGMLVKAAGARAPSADAADEGEKPDAPSGGSEKKEKRKKKR